ncbi:MAG: ABC-2 transporter permease [Oscillospiraceae bacterium]
MKGLLKKDFFLISKYMRFLLIYLVLFSAIFAISSKSVSGGLRSAMTVISILLPMYTVTTLSMDETSKWNSMAISFPVTRRQIIGSKYLLALIMLGIGAVLGMVCSGLIVLIGGNNGPSLGENLMISGGLILYNIAMLSVLFPLIYKFGTEKSRIMMLGVYLVPMIFFLIIFNMFKKVGFPKLALVPESIGGIVVGVIVLMAAVFMVSFLISVRIFTKKEF